MTLGEYLKNDPVWQSLKLKLSTIESEKILTKVEYLKSVGAKNFTEEEYKNYLRIANEKNSDNNKE